ncbi:unnamed protein product [Cladocopium goreaui]|uniref:Sulfotransferase n=1 Tax=Cladocopium goreaui TaxID=2562237 RepID=A0A9P1BNI9_9DINO|nr:unnamed protein product [Cladocopium goreaui]
MANMPVSISRGLAMHVDHVAANVWATEHFAEVCGETVTRARVQPQNLWQTCCDPSRYDGFGSVSCFTSRGLQGWEARRCCSLLEPGNFTAELWRSLLRRRRGTRMPSTAPNASSFILVAYHKSGATLSMALLTRPRMRRLLLGSSSVSISWARSLWTATSPSFQRGVFLQEGPRRMMSYWIAPSQMAHPEILNDYLIPGDARVVHMVRKPSELIVTLGLQLVHARACSRLKNTVPWNA